MANSTKESAEAKAKNRSTRVRDYRWLTVVIILVVALFGIVIINNEHAVTDTTKFTDSIDIDNGDLKINWDQYPTTEITLADTITIDKPGNYHITGTLEDGSIIVNAPEAEVRLLLDGATIGSSADPAINCIAAKDLVIELLGENTITDSEIEATDDESTDSEYNADAGLIYSKSDLTFQGTGELTLTASRQDAIVGKDDVKFNSGTYQIETNGDAIHGKDSVYIVGGNFKIDSALDCIESTNDTDAGKGFVLIEGGNLNLASTNAKGLKSVKYILLYGGNLLIDTHDDAVHSDNYVGITGGQININSGDDGIHADRELIIDGGTIKVVKAYEGIESQLISINDGDISLITGDDGINAGGGADESSKNRSGSSPFDADENCILSINGGNIYVNSAGDGVDSNGWLYFNGGTTVIDGPTNNGNGALDSGLGIVMNGGKVIAIGSSGMAENLGNTSSIYNISIYLSAIKPAGTTIEIKNSSDETIFSHTTAKQFSNITAGSEDFTVGGTYRLYLDGGLTEEFTVSNITTTVGKDANNFHRGH